MADEDTPPEPTKLTLSKERWAREGKFLTGRMARLETERLPPGQHLVKDWPVLDLGAQPKVETERWSLRITGAVDNPFVFNWTSFQALPQSEFMSDIHCVTTWSRYDNHWTGVATRDLLDAVSPRAEAGHVLLHSYDNYTTNLTLEDFAAEDAILAHSWEGKPLTRQHGGPVRLVLPHLYFWKSAKWISRIDFLPDNHPGFWEVRGYHDRGDPWREERYSDD